MAHSKIKRFWLFLAGLVLFPLYLTGVAWAAVSVDVVQDDGQKKPVDLYSSSYALVIGIDQYENGWPILSNAVNDANSVAAALETRGFDVTLKVNLKRRELIDALREFFIIKGEDPDARLLLWFAGHGYTENSEGFIIPADGAVPEEGAKFRLTALPMRDVSTFVRLAQSKHVLTIFDSCFAGTVFDTPRSKPPRVISLASTRPVRQFLTSGDAFQQVSDDGTFRKLFLGALNGDEDADLNGDGYVTGTELGFFMTNRMTNLTEGRQTPRYGKLRDREYDRGDFVFASIRPKQPRVAEPRAQPVVTPDTRKYSPELETAFWTSIQGSEDWRDYQAYVDRFGADGAFTSLAERRVQRLKAAENAANSSGLGAVAPVNEVDQAFWDSIRESDDWRDYQIYINKYGQTGAFFQQAWQRYGDLRTKENEAIITIREAEQTEVAAEIEVTALPPELPDVPAVAEPEIIETSPVVPQPDPPEPMVDPIAEYKAAEAKMGLSRRKRTNIQRALTALGHSTRGIDGVLGRNSRKAIASYQRRKGLEPTGYLNADMYRRLIREAPPPPPAKSPAESLGMQTKTALNTIRSTTGRPYDGRWKFQVTTIAPNCPYKFDPVSDQIVVTAGSFGRTYRQREKQLRIKGKISNGQIRLWGEVILLSVQIKADIAGEINAFDKTLPLNGNQFSTKLNTLREGHCKVTLQVNLSR